MVDKSKEATEKGASWPLMESKETEPGVPNEKLIDASDALTAADVGDSSADQRTPDDLEGHRDKVEDSPAHHDRMETGILSGGEDGTGER